MQNYRKFNITKYKLTTTPTDGEKDSYNTDKFYI